MKLNNKILISNILLSVVILLITGIGMYLLVKNTIYEELDNHLLQHKYDIDNQLDENPESLEVIQKLGGFISNEWVHIEPFDGSIPRNSDNFSTIDTLRGGLNEESPEAYRRLKTTVTLGDELYTLTLYEEVAAWNRISITILISIMAGLFVWILLLYLVNQAVFNRILAPFYTTVETLENIKDPIQFDKRFPESDTHEIDVLNRALNTMMKQIRSSFEDQKMFIQNASHELLTPLSIIRQKAEKILAASDKLDREIAESANDIQQTAVRLSRLSDALLLISRVENKQYSIDENVDLHHITDQLLKELDDFINLKQQSIETDFEVPIRVKGNKELINSAIHNIVQNAIKFSPPGSKIFISTREDKEGALRFSVNDEGPGIPDSVIHSVFDRFKKGKNYSSKEAENGIGLGLSIVKSICQMHGFECYAKNTAEGGAEVGILF